MRAWSALLFSPLLLAGCGQGDDPLGYAEYAVQGTYTAALSPDASYGVVGSIQHGGSLWDINRNERLYNWNHQQGDYTNLVATAFSPEGDFAVTAGPQDLVLWQVNDGQPVWYWNAPAEILAADLGPGGNLALLGLADHTAVLFDIKNGGVRQTVRHQGRVRAVAISDDGTLALTGGDDNHARLWSLASGEMLQQQPHGNGVNTVALSPSGDYAFSAGQLDKALIWRTDSGQITQTLTTDESLLPQRITYTAAVFSPNSDRLLTGTSAGLVQLWNVSDGRELKRWTLHKRDPFRPTSATVYAVGFGGGNRYFALGSNGFVNQLGN
ncbi:WD40 repeat domain-containing protein [Motiliproteus sediminis]|uniref:WD40 repeat domain-containing protein n=1 Tax=Motiliproteus sediminis TaxID=1468178 RepID=UPI001AEFDECB|nr:hypothetical protein [Motiliproteus sediminis]